MIYIYALSDPRTPEDYRYVGQTGGKPRLRLLKHISCARYQNKTKTNAWVRELLELGLEPKMTIIEQVPDEQLAEAEKYWIALYRGLGYDLLNMTSGGQAHPRKYETEEEAKAAWRAQNTAAAERWRRKQGMRKNEERRMTDDERRIARNESCNRYRRKKREANGP